MSNAGAVLVDPRALPRSAEERAVLFAAGGLRPKGSHRPKGEIAFSDPDRLINWDAGGGMLVTQFNPSILITRKGMRLLDLMRLDDQVVPSMALRTRSAISTGWKISSPGEMDQVDDVGRVVSRWPVAEFVEWALEDALDRSLETILDEVLGTRNAYGYSISEKVWKNVKGGRYDGAMCYHDLPIRKPHSFEFAADEFGNLIGIRQFQNLKMPELPPTKFLIAVRDKEWGNWYGRPELEAAYPWWFIKDNLRRWFGSYLEMFSIPPIIGKYDPDAIPAATKEDIKGILKRIQARTTMLIPDLNFVIEALEVPTQKDVFEQAFNLCNQGISRALLLPGMVGFTPDSATGSFARAKVHFDVFLHVLEADRVYLAEQIINKQIIRPLVDVNFGKMDEYPFFEWLPLTADATSETAETWTKLLTSGAVVNQESDEIHLRSLLEFPEKIVDPEAAETPPVEDNPDEDPTPPGPDNPEEELPEEDEKPEDTDPEDESSETYRHENGMEQFVSFDDLEGKMDMTADVGRAKAGAAIEASQEELLGRLEAEGDDGGDIAFIEGLTISGEDDVAQAFNEMLTDSLADGMESLTTEVEKASGEKFASAPNFVPTDAVAFLNQKALQLAASQNAKLLGEVKLVLSNRLKTGGPMRKAMGEIRDLFRKYIGDAAISTPGGVATPWALEAIVRTETTGAFNQGRLVQARNPDLAPFMRGMEYSAILDDRTTPVCEDLDEKIFTMDDPMLDRLTPPNHVNCRSLLVPVTISQEVEQKDFVTESESGRAADQDNPRGAGKGFS